MSHSQKEIHVQPSTSAPLVKDGTASQPQFIYVYPSDSTPIASGAGSSSKPSRRATTDRPAQDWLRLVAKQEVIAAVSFVGVVLFGWGWTNRTIAELKHESYFEGYNSALMDARQQINQAKAAQAAAEAQTAAANATIAQVQAIVGNQPASTPAPAAVPTPAVVPSPAPTPSPAQ